VSAIRLPQRAAFAAVALVYAVVMLGGTIPIPLWGIWAEELRFGPFVITLAFGLYAAGTMASLTLLSSWSDHAGRRLVLFAGLGLSAVSAGLLLAAPNVLVVLAARVLGGLGAGLTATTASAALAELGPARRAATVATVSNVGGLGAGVAVAAVALQLGGESLETVAVLYACYLGAVVLCGLAVTGVPETVAERRSGGLAFRRPLLPAARDRRLSFAWAAMGVFVAFTVTGLFSSLVPSFLRDELGVQEPIVPGLIVASLFGAALVGQTLTPPALVDRVWPGPAAMAVGTAVFELGLLTGALGLFVTGTVIAGVGFGLAFRRGLGVAQRVAEPSRRADQLATYFLSAYAGNVLPTLGLGALSQVLDARSASLAIAAVIVLGALLAGAGGARRAGSELWTTTDRQRTIRSVGFR
jgi:predicted MFS family arabinose efflux permease